MQQGCFERVASVIKWTSVGKGKDGFGWQAFMLYFMWRPSKMSVSEPYHKIWYLSPGPGSMLKDDIILGLDTAIL